jgi:hypothetical protein
MTKARFVVLAVALVMAAVAVLSGHADLAQSTVAILD